MKSTKLQPNFLRILKIGNNKGLRLIQIGKKEVSANTTSQSLAPNFSCPIRSTMFEKQPATRNFEKKLSRRI